MNSHARLLKLGLDGDPSSPRSSSRRTLASAPLPRYPTPTTSSPACPRAPATPSSSPRSSPPSPAPPTSPPPRSASSPSSSAAPAPPLPLRFSAAAAAAASSGDLAAAPSIHAQALRRGLLADVVVSTSLLHMYSKCGALVPSRKVFDEMPLRNTVTYNAMLAAYSNAGSFAPALDLFYRMRCGDVSSAERAMEGKAECRSVGSALMMIKGYIFNESALIDMYCKCRSINEAWLIFSSLEQKHVSHWNSMITGFIYNGLVDDARRMFDEMPEKNVISWTSMISGYIQHGLPHEGLTLLRRLYSEDGPVRANSFTFASALDACSCMAALKFGKQIHTQALRMLLGGQSNEKFEVRKESI
uniref:Pentatricopeptide repeat-containing protein n=1 Tax=Ananas comosus var. bracteatus TaxID=296719 RepID=A0A6V7QD50_ANACO|nr:unnamed protein product [Ananas comosus var. bracteatus]